MTKNFEIDLPHGYTEILRVEVGSTVHGISVGNDDRDEMGVCIEPPEAVIGLSSFEQHTYRTAWERLPQGEGGPRRKGQPKSQPGDLDLIIYSLRKWCRMALTGNPTALLLLYSPVRIVDSPVGRELRELREAFISRQVGNAFLKYLRQQRERLEGSRGQKDVHRPDLEAKYAFDVKYASHVIRLGLQGLEFVQNRTITLPMIPEHRNHIQAIRRGEIPYTDVIHEAQRLETRLVSMLANHSLPTEPKESAVNQFLVRAYQSVWRGSPD